MKFKLEIKCDNAAFEGSQITTNEEVARILRQVVDQLRIGYTYSGLYDINGNHVGEFKFTGVKT